MTTPPTAEEKALERDGDEWHDTQNVNLPDGVVMGKGWDPEGFELLREETGDGWAVWHERGGWSACGGPEGVMAYCTFDSEAEAKEFVCAERAGLKELARIEEMESTLAAQAEEIGGLKTLVAELRGDGYLGQEESAPTKEPAPGGEAGG